MAQIICATSWHPKARLYLSVLAYLSLMMIASHNALAYTVEENFSFIDRMVAKLNNNKECDLPSFAEVDELNNCFKELKVNLGDHLELRLNADHKLIRITLLDQWDSFRDRMTDAVVIRSAKTRAFLGKVEKYQRAKFGDSVCTRMTSRGIVLTDRIFEKNPIVRYLKHLDTHEVVERPEEQQTTTPALQNLRPLNLGLYFPDLPDDDVIEPTTTNAATPATHTGHLEEQVDSRGVVHRLIGQYIVDHPEEILTPQASNSSHSNRLSFSNADDDAIDDPLAALPNPANENKSQIEAYGLRGKSDQDGDSDSNKAPYQQEGVEYVDAKLNDRMLARLVRKQRRTVDADPILDISDWPDESRLKRNEQIAAKKIYDQVANEWTEFMKDPFPKPEVVAEEQVVRPQLNMNTIQKQKQEFLERNRLANRMSNLIGWNDDSYPQDRYLVTTSGKKRKNDSESAHDAKRSKKHSDESERPFAYPNQQQPSLFGQMAEPDVYRQPTQSLFQQQQTPLFSQPQRPLFQQPQESLFQNSQQYVLGQEQPNVQQIQSYQQPAQYFQQQQQQQQRVVEQRLTPLFEQQPLQLQQLPSTEPGTLQQQIDSQDAPSQSNKSHGQRPADKWTKLADNNLCKINYNKSYVPRHAKAAKSWIKSTTAQAAKRVLLAVEDLDNEDKKIAARVNSLFPKKG